jgi:D-threo-aldose 1-dehydrogenase
MPNPSELVPLGRTDVLVTQLGLGTAPLGNMFRSVDERDGLAAVTRAWDLGLRFFDTAPLYGHGLAERRLGEALRAQPRDACVVATKVGRLLRTNRGPVPSSIFADTPAVHPVFDFSARAALRSLEESLDRLGLERVDVLHVHDPDHHAAQALGGAFPALRQLRAEGRIRAIGAGMNQSAMLARFVREADVDCVLLAGRYSLLDQGGLDELLPLCVERGVAVIAAGVFNSGLLATPEPGATFDYEPAPPALVARAQQLSALCEEYQIPLRAAALQFPLAHPAVLTVLSGARSAAEIEENATLFAQPIPSALWDRLRREGFIRDDAPTP